MPKKPQLKLDTPVRYVKGVGPKMADRLKKLEIKTVGDLIHHYPFRHEDYSQISLIKNCQPGEKVTLIGKISNFSSSQTRSAKQKSVQKAVFSDSTGEIELLWFNQPYLKKIFTDNVLVSLSGEIEKRRGRMQMIFPRHEIIDDDKPTKDTGRLVPIYPATYGISDKYLRKIIYQVIFKVKNQIEEYLPDDIRKEFGLLPRKEAVVSIHFPENRRQLKLARQRIAFDELTLIHLKNLQKKEEWKQARPALEIKNHPKVIKKFVESLAFQLTSAQKRVIKEILTDLQQPNSMNRLLQGDVGSGKTVVAATGVLQTVKNNYQSVLMAPTEILAQQHFKTLSEMLRPFKINCQLLTSSTTKQTNPQPLAPKTQLLIGTHALIHKHAQFDQVGLVIIDEQHRFGVEQRAKLVKKAQTTGKDKLFPHLLTMTATPIPRTIALTLYGNLDVSTLDEMPPGRKPVKTWLVPKAKREDCYQWIKSQAEKGSQGFIICPLVEESENLQSVKAASEEFDKLSKQIFPKLRLGLVHGRMKSNEKESVLEKMHQGKIDILVATPVVEVGIDVPKAKFMIIEGANRFGLAQLHQLRGRVGRGEEQAFCFLFAEKISQRARKRLRAMETINDGLKLAKIDLKIRGPGEIYGTKQHGYPELKVANYNDLELIKKTRQAAKQVHLRGVSL